MSLRPTQRNENHNRRRPRENGGPSLVRETMDSRFRGNDVIFESAKRGILLCVGRPSPKRLVRDSSLGSE